MSQPRKRVYIACSNCRKAKVKCETDEQEPRPCQRCIQKGLDCVYLPVPKETPPAASPDHGKSAGTSVSPSLPQSTRGFGPPSSHGSRRPQYASAGLHPGPLDQPRPQFNPGGPGFPPPPANPTISYAFSNHGPVFGNTPQTVQPRAPPQYVTPAPQTQEQYPYPWKGDNRPPFYPRSQYVSLYEPFCTIPEIYAGIAFVRPDVAAVVVEPNSIALRHLWKLDTGLDVAQMLK
ncbi:hypothetical protein C8R45DRAFT_929252 [Mycena sanguinolenta]|nr:hypothetical protein C8R45DRAFT_929252 [Mycena sanguinolenta]